MLLISSSNFFTNLIDWIEKHPQTSSLISAIIPCICIAGFLGFIFKAQIEERNKRIKAETSLFPPLKREIVWLRNVLEKNERLKATSYNSTNIFLMLYPYDQRKVSFRSFKYDTSSSEHARYVEKCAEIKKLINATDCNVPPKRTDRKKWYNSQDILLLFCDFIIGMNDQESPSVNYYGSLDSQAHISKSEELSNAMGYLIKSMS